MEKTQKLKSCLSRAQAFCHFTFLNFHVFLLPPRKQIQLLTRFLCIAVLCLFGFSLRTSAASVVSSMANFVVHAGFNLQQSNGEN